MIMPVTRITGTGMIIGWPHHDSDASDDFDRVAMIMFCPLNSTTVTVTYGFRVYKFFFWI